MYPKKMIFFASFFVSSSLLGSASAFALSDAELREVIQDKIRERHPTANCEWWKSQGENTAQVVLLMTEKPERKLDLLRLIEGLGCFKDEASLRKVREFAEQATNSVDRTTAIRAAVRGGAGGDAETPPLVKDWIKGFLSHSDAQTRAAAAVALTDLKTPETQAWVKEYLTQEKEAWIVQKVEKRIQRKGESKEPGQVTGIVAPVAITRAGSDREASPSDLLLLRKKWSGTWNGYRIKPPHASEDATTEAVVLEFSFAGTEPVLKMLSGKSFREARQGGASSALLLSDIRVQKERFVAKLSEPRTKEKPETRVSFDLEGDLREESAGISVLIVRVRAKVSNPQDSSLREASAQRFVLYKSDPSKK